MVVKSSVIVIAALAVGLLAGIWGTTRPINSKGPTPTGPTAVEASRAGGLAGQNKPADSIAPDSVRFEPSIVDLGELAWFSKVPFVATLRNRSVDSVIIAAVRPSCGCTDVNTSALAGLEIAPGMTCEIVGRMQTSREDGLFDRPIEVLLKSGEIHTVTLRYRNRPTYSVRPSVLHFGEVNLDSPEVVFRSFFVESLSGGQLEPVVRSDVDWVDFAIVEQTESRTEIIATLIKSRLRRGYEMKPFSISTTDPYVPDFRSEVDYVGIAELAAVPPLLVIEPCGSGVIQVTRRSGDPTKLVCVETTHSGFELNIEPPGEAFSVIAKCDAPSTAVLRVTDADGRTCSARVRILAHAVQ